MSLKETQPVQYPRNYPERILAKELDRFLQDPIPGISVGPRGDNLRFWDCVILGPPGTPWEEGVFQLTVSVPSDYPFRGPHIVFKSRIFHPNVYLDGSVCTDAIDQPSLTISKKLLTIQALLDDPCLEYPANAEAAVLYSTDSQEYNRKVHEICATTRRTTESYLVNGLIGFDGSKQAEPSVASDDSGSTSSMIQDLQLN